VKQPERGGDGYVQSFARGLAVIRCFGPQARALTLSQVAERSSLTRAGARRILLTLRALGYVTADGRLFSLTPRILELGYSYLASLLFWDFAEPVLEELAATTGESCNIGVLDGTDIVYVMRVATHRILTANFTIGTRLPAYVTSMGRVLLGGLSSEEYGRFTTAADLKPLTKKTVTSAAQLRRIVAAGRERGWVYVGSELEDGICGIAVPLFDAHRRVIAAINVSLSVSSSAEEHAVKVILPHLQRAAARINSQLQQDAGPRPPQEPRE
jgi:IclR family pca regulon transcriptional regulator